jgi:hypothetical protein
VRKRLAIVSVVFLVVSIVGFVASDYLNAFVFDNYDAYGEVPIPATRTVHLPDGDVTVSFHTELVGTMEGGDLPIPPDLMVTIAPPNGVAEPELIENIGGTTTNNQDAHRQLGVARVPVAGDYTITTDGKVTAFLSPRLSFGHGSSFGFLLWLFGGLFGVSLLVLLAAPFVGPRTPSNVRPKRETPLQQLTTLASLHDSGALTDEEYEAEKRRLLDSL